MSAMDEEISLRIKVIGIGDSGGNILQNMVTNCPEEVELVTINSDARAVQNVSGITPIQINLNITKERNASDIVAVRAKAEKEIADQVIEKINGADLVFLATDLSEKKGYTTISAVANVAKKIQNALTIAIVAIPIQTETATSRSAADEAISELAEHVHLFIPMSSAAMRSSDFNKNAGQNDIAIRNEMFCQVIQGIYEPLTNRGMIGIDFADYKTIFHEPGIAAVGLGRSNTRVDRGEIAAKMALSNPLTVTSLDEKYSFVFASIACGSFKCLQDYLDASAEIQAKYCNIEDFIFGVPVMESMKNEIRVIVVATGSEPESLQDFASNSVDSGRHTDSVEKNRNGQ